MILEFWRLLFVLVRPPMKFQFMKRLLILLHQYIQWGVSLSQNEYGRSCFSANDSLLLPFKILSSLRLFVLLAVACVGLSCSLNPYDQLGDIASVSLYQIPYGNFKMTLLHPASLPPLIWIQLVIVAGLDKLGRRPWNPYITGWSNVAIV
jgi:hypothetical protein